MTITVSPAPFVQPQYFDENGNPVSSGNLYTYAAGTLTPQASYVDAEHSAENPNPIILDAAGRCNIFLDDSLVYHLVLMDVTNTITYFDQDNIVPVGSTTNLTSGAIITALGYTPYNATNPNNYISANQGITLTGAVTGTGSTSIATTIAPTGVTAAAYTAANITVNAAGQITAAASNTPILTTKGDLAGFTTVPARVPVGTDGQVLTADSSQADGLSWQTPTGSIVTNHATAPLTIGGSGGVLADAEMTVSLEAASTYQVTFYIYFSSGYGPQMGIHYTGSFGNGGFFFAPAGNAGLTPPYDINTNFQFENTFPSESLIVCHCSIATNAAANLVLYWGQTGQGSTGTRYISSSVVAIKT